MSVAAYDSRQAFRQDAIARLGEDKVGKGTMTKEQKQQMADSPFMQTMRKVESATLDRVSERDKKRAKNDPSFKPSDADFQAPKAHNYNKSVDYYMVLGVEEFSSQDEIKKQYRKMSLQYHPDKMANKSQEEKDEASAIFIELKNAYKTLSDNPTRRQYDYDRDRELASADVNGHKVKKREAPISAQDLLKALQERKNANQKAPAETIEVPLNCKLEKMVFGGQKSVERSRMKKLPDREGGGFEQVWRLFRIDLPQGAPTPFESLFKRGGDAHEGKETDNLKFIVSAKPHEYVERMENDLRLKENLDLGDGMSAQPALDIAMTSLKGRHLRLWGHNPFSGCSGESALLRIYVKGQGVTKDSFLKATARMRLGKASAPPRMKATSAPQPDPTEFLQRFKLGPKWGLGKTAPVDGQNRSDAKEHPTMRKRIERKAKEALHAECELEFTQVGKPLMLYTKPTCSLTFYSNRKQLLSANSRGPVAPRFMFGFCLESAACASGAAAADWERLQKKVAPLLRKYCFSMARQAQEVLPRTLTYKPMYVKKLDALFLPMEEEEEEEEEEVPVPETEPVDGPDFDVKVFIDRECDLSVEMKVARGTLTEELKKKIASEAGADAAGIVLKVGESYLADGDRILSKMTEIDVCDASSVPAPKPKAEPKASPTKKTRSLASYAALVRRRALLEPSAKALGDAAFSKGDNWHAIACYSKALAEIPEDDDLLPKEQAKAHDAAAKVLSNRAACFAKLGDFAASLADAERATELSPEYGKAWSRVGLAAWHSGQHEKSLGAYTKAVAFDPTDNSVRTLGGIATKMESSVDEAHKAKELGNVAIQEKKYGAAVAQYTIGLSRLPPAPAQPEKKESLEDKLAPPPVQDPHSLIRGILYTNRCAAYIWMVRWDAAIADGKQAASTAPAFMKARLQLGVAYLGRKMHELAYAEFARAVQADPENLRAANGRKACLAELSLMKSAIPQYRIWSRFGIDLKRPKGTTRVFAVSDVHFEIKENENWVHDIDSYAFQNDVLIIAGNIAASKVGVERGLRALKSKFRRIFYMVGNIELAITFSDWGKWADSIAKLHAIFQSCDELGIDIYPAPVADGVFVVPLLSWYNPEFDAEDPFPNPSKSFDEGCKWPMDPDTQVWRYLLRLNEEHLKTKFYGDVITFSHFLPRQDLPWDKTSKSAVKAMGCTGIDEQARGANSKMHVFGHSLQKYAQAHEGVKYVQMPMGIPRPYPGGIRDAEEPPRFMMVHDGHKFCSNEWMADGEPPLGFIKRVHHVGFYAMPSITPSNYRDLIRWAEQMGKSAGCEVSFMKPGSNRFSKEEFYRDVWPDGKDGLNGITHVLQIVADDLDKLKACMNSDVYKTQMSKFLNANATLQCVIDAPLSMDLQHEGKGRDDPVLVLVALRLSKVRDEEHEVIQKMQKAIASINNPSFSQGKLAAGLMPTGHSGLGSTDLSKKVHPDCLNGCGMTHLLAFYVTTGETFRLLAGSKTFARIREAYKPELSKLRFNGFDLPPEIAVPFSLDITAGAAAPKPPKKKGPRKADMKK
mmetsp:Transcript_4137/g.7502  ORF Transcript_4137/g.7502 Transcript_4137/m.7502 type:complete len:1538 (+) Transcript_4137:132-4745(+)